MTNNNEFVKVDDYKTPEDALVTVNGRLVEVKFSKLFNRPDLQDFESLIIKKQSVVNFIDRVVQYINYFEEYYDQDHELLMAYFAVKYFINKHRGMKSDVGVTVFREYLYRTLFTPSMKDKIARFVEDNYTSDVTLHEGAKKCGDTTRFTNEHAKILYRVSMALKVMIPLSFHFININHYDTISTLKLLNMPLLEMFTDEGVDMRTKLWGWLKDKTDTIIDSNKKIYKQLEVYEKDPYARTKDLLEKDLMVDIMYKYVFSENAIIFNNVVMRNQITYSLKEKWDHNLNEVSSDFENSSATYIDMLLRNLTTDETPIVVSTANIEREIERLRKQISFITDEEIEYYMDNHINTKLQEKIVEYYYAKEFGGLFDLQFLTRRQYITLLVILKRRLLVQRYVYLPQLLSGNKIGRINNRIIQNNKFITKLVNSEAYKVIIEEKYSLLTEMEKHRNNKERDVNSIVGLMSTLINTKFGFVDFDAPSRIGDQIELNTDVFCSEMLRYVALI